MAVLLSNRSAAHAGLGQAILALEDAEGALALRPDWSRAWGRKANALHLSGAWAEAETAYLQALALEPDNSALQNGLEAARTAAAASTGGAAQG